MAFEFKTIRQRGDFLLFENQTRPVFGSPLSWTNLIPQISEPLWFNLVFPKVVVILPPEARRKVLLEDITHAFVVRGTLRKYLGHGMNFATIAEVSTYILKQAMI